MNENRTFVPIPNALPRGAQPSRCQSCARTQPSELSTIHPRLQNSFSRHRPAVIQTAIQRRDSGRSQPTTRKSRGRIPLRDAPHGRAFNAIAPPDASSPGSQGACGTLNLWMDPIHWAEVRQPAADPQASRHEAHGKGSRFFAGVQAVLPKSFPHSCCCPP